MLSTFQSGKKSTELDDLLALFIIAFKRLNGKAGKTLILMLNDHKIMSFA
jgi:hypothetical protein